MYSVISNWYKNPKNQQSIGTKIDSFRRIQHLSLWQEVGRLDLQVPCKDPDSYRPSYRSVRWIRESSLIESIFEWIPSTHSIATFGEWGTCSRQIHSVHYVLANQFYSIDPIDRLTYPTLEFHKALPTRLSHQVERISLWKLGLCPFDRYYTSLPVDRLTELW